MTHAEFEILLATRRDLTPEEEEQLAAHLAGCAECQDLESDYAQQDADLRSLRLPAAPTNLPDAALRPRTARYRFPLPSYRWIGLGVVAAMAAVAVLLIFPNGTQQGQPPPADAYSLLQRVENSAAQFPYEGTSEISYVGINREQVPVQAPKALSLQRVIVHYAVHDASHFRVDIQTVRPVLDAGTLTVVVNGRSITSYDTRTATAGRVVVPRVPWKVIRPQLLSWLTNGLLLGSFSGSLGSSGSLSSSGAEDPVQVVRSYLQNLTGPAGPYCQARVIRLVGRTTIAGRPADEVMFRPLWANRTVTGCSFEHPGHCASRVQSGGAGYVWIDTGHPFILASLTRGIEPEAALIAPFGLHARMRVLSIAYGTGPSIRNLATYHPPVPIKATSWTPFTTGSGNGHVGPPFLATQFPDVAAFENGVSTNATNYVYGPLKRTVALDEMYVTGSKQGSPYLFVQQRLRVQGLPATLRIGTPSRAGQYEVWLGTYNDGQHWAAFQSGVDSVRISTNTMTSAQLLQYIHYDMSRQ